MSVAPAAYPGLTKAGCNFGNKGGGVPKSQVRAICREHGLKHGIPVLVEIVNNPDASPAERTRAVDVLLRVGCGDTALPEKEWIQNVKDAIAEVLPEFLAKLGIECTDEHINDFYVQWAEKIIPNYA